MYTLYFEGTMLLKRAREAGNSKDTKQNCHKGMNIVIQMHSYLLPLSSMHGLIVGLLIMAKGKPVEGLWHHWQETIFNNERLPPFL